MDKKHGGLPHKFESFDSPRRPLSLEWITEEMIEETQWVWSPLYRRAISEQEVVEILMNVKRFAKVLLKIAQQRVAEKDE